MNTLNLKISISGASHTGKSALAEKIAQILRAADIEVSVVDDNGIGIVEEHPGVVAGSLTDRLQSIALKKIPVEIRTFIDKRSSV